MRRAFNFTWATIDPETISSTNPAQLMNLVGGKWTSSSDYLKCLDPLFGGEFLYVPNTSKTELEPYYKSISAVSKSGIHNPLKNVERYRTYGQVCQRVASYLNQEEYYNYFARLIQRAVPKHTVQARGEIGILKTFCENFSGDQVRFLARGFSVPGDHLGQQSHGYRWPYGPVGIVAPFNFPLEIPICQLLGALFMGNAVTIKPDPKAALCLEQFVRFLHFCGMPLEDVNILHGTGEPMEQLIRDDLFRCIQFTGSSRIADHLSVITKGKVKVEDAGFDWKVLGPDVHDFDYVAWTSDQDAYAFSGQKCSAQSILFAHNNWVQAGIFDKLKQLAERRSLNDLSICPVLTWNNEKIQRHVDACAAIPGARVLFGGRPLDVPHSIPEIYGSYYPTAVYVPIDQIPKHWDLVTTELFGPFQIVTEWNNIEDVLAILEKLSHHLTAAVVTKDQQFANHVLGRTVNGTTYAGIRARTTGAPQNHWFGPSGDPRAAGIATPEAIQLVWSSHREIISDIGPVPENWTIPPPS
ncbi:unnamed protein product [Blepharisma stoltei]|uniref:Aldehyde dehydrogenase domain-containing protein n=1 Tax=Blepharisma stoltei TaxID=1481888 RepID=A0AAU9KIQ4_9CILI|nr:unnamed protein product [Blepharisma stoltei]